MSWLSLGPIRPNPYKIGPSLMQKLILTLLPQLPEYDTEFKSECNFTCNGDEEGMSVELFSELFIKPCVLSMLQNQHTDFKDPLGFLKYGRFYRASDSHLGSRAYVVQEYDRLTQSSVYYMFLHYVPHQRFKAYFWLGGAEID